MAETIWIVPSSVPTVDEDDIETVVRVLRSGVLANGPQAALLEAEFASFADVPHAIAVSSGTAGLVLVGQALGLRPRDTVLVAGFTFAATANAFLSLGCRVVPVDVDPVTMNLDPRSLQDAIRSEPMSRAVVIVDLFGSTVGTEEAFTIARDAGLLTIEDAAQAHGARTSEGDPVGGRADATVFSLYATKNMAGGEGGVVTTPGGDVDDAVRRLRNHGGLRQYEHAVLGLNHRITEVSAALARRQLGRLEDGNRARRQLARDLARWCDQAWGQAVAIPPEATTTTLQHVFHQFTLRFARPDLRDDVAGRLRRAGVDARTFYPYAVRDLPMVEPRATPQAERLRDTVLSLPVHPNLSSAQVRHLREAVLTCALAAVAQ